MRLALMRLRRPVLLQSSDRTTLSVAVMTPYVTPSGPPVNNLPAAVSVLCHVVPIPADLSRRPARLRRRKSTTGRK
ncbi:hypothetical protein QF032_007668 [Streptomyces achromogenes]|uniref:Uncharacterized protein n=1 Tax=Streptomyces achromogenes TaxID=67255 RepID=A0ABU0QDB4_STRAH|nr:hypothetical protein [Streptomyces achromogenes]MDQ0688632.1 hypothetical protein [Streptomyces achromogenes]MDQ0835824.1 hypothetical protein [Streptomyces achromogenes]